MVRIIFRVYRFLLPASMRRRIPQDIKEYISSVAMLVATRDFATLKTHQTAWNAKRKGDLGAAVEQWQMVAALSTPINLQLQDGALLQGLSSSSHSTARESDLDALSDHDFDTLLQATQPALGPNVPRKLRYAQTELTKARVKLALGMHKEGRVREFRENLYRAIEAIPDQRIFKKDARVLKAVQLYVQDALLEDGALPRPNRRSDDNPSGALVTGLPPLRFAVVVDVMKMSTVHTHSRVILAMCRNLLLIHPQVQAHIIVTNERFTVTTPSMSASFDPQRNHALGDKASKEFPEDFGKRLFVHVFDGNGLEGLVDSCKKIIAINPDVLLYGGGNKGFFSNESRAVRHCLYDVFPTAFFFIQANNAVDDRNDIIIARGPHAIVGTPGEARVQVQPYPTITKNSLEIPVIPRTGSPKTIISATTGVRMDLKMAEQTDADMRTFLAILSKTPDAVWHFIGASDPQAVIDSNKDLARSVAQGRVVVHPVLPLEAFSELVRSASLFLHLPGFTGGSGGAAIARNAGVPILTFKHSDVSGRQPAETIFEKGEASAFAKKAVQLLHDPEAWSKTVHSQNAFSDGLRKTSGQGFYDCLVDAVKIGENRLKRVDGNATDTRAKAG